MYYEINISKNGKHFFATAKRSITTTDKLKTVYDALSTAFPECELTVTKYEKTGTVFNLGKMSRKDIIDSIKTIVNQNNGAIDVIDLKLDNPIENLKFVINKFYPDSTEISYKINGKIARSKDWYYYTQLTYDELSNILDILNSAIAKKYIK